MLNERLKNLRLAKGMTLQQVGDAFGISKASVSSWESGKSHPDHKKLEQLADLLGSTVSFLISGKVETERTFKKLIFKNWSALAEQNQGLLDSLPFLPMHSNPGVNAFVTRYPGSTELYWQYGGIPPGSILLVDPDLTPGPLDTVVVQLQSGAVVLAKFEQTPENKKLLVLNNSPKYEKLDLSAIKILGVTLEWQLSGKIK